jgi:tetratricopeptide (TPR) repeat protein
MMGFAGMMGALALAIVPTQARDAARAVIKVRGGDDAPADVRATTVDAKVFAGRTRLAVLPFVVPSADASLASQETGGMDSIAADLRYVPAYLIVDRTEVLAALRRQAKAHGGLASDLPAIAAELGVKALIVGNETAHGANLSIELTYLQIVGKEAKAVATSSVSGPKSDIYHLEDKALLGLLAELKTTPAADRIAEMTKIPTHSFDARSHADAGFAVLDQVAGLDHADGTFATLNKKALEHAKASIKADRNNLPAYLLRASGLHNLGSSTELKDCLESARKKNDPSRADLLTGFELEGDYLAFHDGQFADAAKQYEKILAYDPGNLHALWSLIGLYSGDYGAVEFARAPTAKQAASRYAAQLIQAHPSSAAAEVFTPKPSQP